MPQVMSVPVFQSIGFIHEDVGDGPVEGLPVDNDRSTATNAKHPRSRVTQQADPKRFSWFTDRRKCHRLQRGIGGMNPEGLMFAVNHHARGDSWGQWRPLVLLNIGDQIARFIDGDHHTPQ